MREEKVLRVVEELSADVRAALERAVVRALGTVGVLVKLGGQPQHPLGIALYFCEDGLFFKCAEAFRKAGLHVEALPCTPGGPRGLSMLVAPGEFKFADAPTNAGGLLRVDPGDGLGPVSVAIAPGDTPAQTARDVMGQLAARPTVGACPACGAEPGTNIDCKRCMSGVDKRKPPSASGVTPNEPGTHKVGMAWAGKTAEMHRAIGAAVAEGKSVCVVSPDKTVVARPEVVATAPSRPSETCMLCTLPAPPPRPICEACDAALGERGEPLSRDAYDELSARTVKAFDVARLGCVPAPWFTGTRGPVLCCGNHAFLADASRALEAAGLGWEVLDKGRDLLRVLPAHKAAIVGWLRTVNGPCGLHAGHEGGHAFGFEAEVPVVTIEKGKAGPSPRALCGKTPTCGEPAPAVPFCERHRTHGNTCSACDVEAGRLVLAEPKAGDTLCVSQRCQNRVPIGELRCKPCWSAIFAALPGPTPESLEAFRPPPWPAWCEWERDDPYKRATIDRLDRLLGWTCLSRSVAEAVERAERELAARIDVADRNARGVALLKDALDEARAMGVRS